MDPAVLFREVYQRPRDKPVCNVRWTREARGSSVGNECGRKVREGLSHEGWGGFQENKMGWEEWTFQKEGSVCSSILKSLRKFHSPGLLHTAVTVPLLTGPVADAR